MNYNNPNEQTSRRMNVSDYDSNEAKQSFQQSMVAMWETMARLYHPQWTRTNGEIGGVTFQNWARELLPYGSKAVLTALGSIRDSGSSYMPPLAKFMSLGRSGNADKGTGDFGHWETCPYTGRQRRLRPGHELLAARLGSKYDPRSNDEIRQDIERYIADGQPDCYPIYDPNAEVVIPEGQSPYEDM